MHMAQNPEKKVYSYSDLVERHGDDEKFGIVTKQHIGLHGYWFQDWMLDFQDKFFTEIGDKVYQVV